MKSMERMINALPFAFQEPRWFWAFALVPILAAVIYYREKRSQGDFKMNLLPENLAAKSWGLFAFRILYLLLPIFLYSFLILALAQPYSWRKSLNKNQESTYGIDIMLAIDQSLSMQATDFYPNRIEVAKKVASDFIQSRKGDKIGLVFYSGQALLACYPTLDYGKLLQKLNEPIPYDLEPGTAIGVGLGTSLIPLRNKQIRSKVVILLTDGTNNAGDVSPMEAAQIAQGIGTRVYTIGVGTIGIARTPRMTVSGVIYENIPVEIDELTLRNIAELTGGAYYRANDENTLRYIYQQIETLEKRKIPREHRHDYLPSSPEIFLVLALLCWILMWVFDQFIFISSSNA